MLRTFCCLLLLLAAFDVRAQATLDNIAGQGAGSIDAERLRPGLDREAIADVESGAVSDDVDVGFQLGYANNPLRGTMTANGSASSFSIVAHRLGGNLTGAIGLFGRFKLGVDVPVVLFQSGAAALPGLKGPNPVAVAGLGDVRVVPKVGLLQVSGGSPVDLALLAHVTLPTSIPRHSYIGDGLPTLTPELALSRDYGALRWATNVGAKLRVPSTFGGVTQGEELTFRAGVGYDLEDVPVGVDVTANGPLLLFPNAFQGNTEPLEALLNVHGDVGDAQLFAGAGAGLLPGIGAPAFRVLAGARWSPRCADEDGDGFCGAADACPTAAEDRDEYQDRDGCPEPDNDGDGILDGEDACPMEAGPSPGCPVKDQDGDGIADDADRCPAVAEDKDGDADEDGCPEEAAPKDTDGDGLTDDVDRCPTAAEDKDGNVDDDGCPEEELARLSLGSAVAFASGSAELREEAIAAIRKLAADAKAANRPFTIRVEGHTDDTGGDAVNVPLSQARADAVKALLLKEGVAADAVQAKGFGASKPLAPNTTAEGRKQNRRVELVVEG